ncbi:DUF4326 domain-containing protein [Methylobacter sp. G7]|uniref:DUF4326 domain-containing protein n=1 Tax=Methylobacter sp. G7 TaxID=3230117 RepID=UPI003D809529
MNNFPRVLNAHIDEIPPGAVWVDRRSPYGNPFKLGIDGDFEQVKELYINYLLANPALIADIRQNLKGKSLVCWCVPDQRCHAEILILIAGDPNFKLDSLL